MGLKDIIAPVPLEADHNRSIFDSNEPILDHWLKERAYKNQLEGATRTYVICVDATVIGYYSLAVGSISRDIATGNIKRNMPEPIPVMIIARLAVHKNWQKKGIGPSLLQDAILRTKQASKIAGIRAILVHAISTNAKGFYQYFGFKESLIDPMILMINLKNVNI